MTGGHIAARPVGRRPILRTRSAWLAASLGSLAVALAASVALPARAEADLFSPEAFAGVVDLRAALTDGELSWRHGGFGKLRYGAQRGAFQNDFGADAEIAEGSLVWKPRFSWELQGVVVGQYQSGQEPAVDLSEAFLRWRPVPRSQTRFEVRAGLYWPQISMEHEDVAWGVTRTITPSAINSWVGEEVKVVGAEGTVRRELGGHQIEATAGIFEGNDTAGTLLTFRGWALGDVKATLNGSYSLPPLSPFMQMIQFPETNPLYELDDRPGWYARVGWTPPGKASFNAFYYDNRGDPQAVNEELQWGWRTRFWNLGARLDPDEKTVLVAQVMWGSTRMGYFEGDEIWADVDFRSAYLLASRQVGAGTLTGRVDWFEVADRTLLLLDNNDEHGWSVTAAYKHPIGEHLALFVEALHVDSDRPSRALAGLPAQQDQTSLQTALRVVF